MFFSVKNWTSMTLALAFFLGMLFIVSGQQHERAAEKKIGRYLQNNLKRGKPLLVTELHQMFSLPEERKVLSRLYNIFFKIPNFLAQYYVIHNQPPKLHQIAEQFDLTIPGEVDVILKIVEYDSRVPRFITRDPVNGEIINIDLEKIRADARFNKIIERSIAGWEGKQAPGFVLQLLDGTDLKLTQLEGKVRLVYFWFSNCPPCMKITPHLVSLQKRFMAQNFSVIGLNADRILELSYPESERLSYLEKYKINFPIGHLTGKVQEAYGGIQLFPSLFLVDKKGIIRRHFVNYQDEATLLKAISEIL